MRYISKLKKKRFSERYGVIRFLQLWFNYHFFFFQSLIFRGLKLRAFTFFVSVKSGLKASRFFPEEGSIISDKNFGVVDNLDEEKVFYKKLLTFDNFLSNKLSDLYNANSGLSSFKNYLFFFFFEEFFIHFSSFIFFIINIYNKYLQKDLKAFFFS